MSLFRRKIRRTAIACLSLTLCATLTASCAMVNLDPITGNPESATSTSSLGFTDVTDKFDTTNLTVQNFNSSVLPGTPSYETRTVIVYLDSPSVLETKSSAQTVSEYINTVEGQQYLRTLDREQKTFLSKLTSQGVSYKLKSTYTTIANAVAIEIDTSYVKRIKGIGGVTSAVIGNTYLAPQTADGSSSAVNLPITDAHVNATGIYDSSDLAKEYLNADWTTGAGTVVAILDTGLDYTHEAFQIDVKNPRMDTDEVSQVLGNTEAYKRIAALGGNLTADSLYVSSKVPFAFDYADNDTDVYPSYSNHGTHVAGIIGGYSEDGYDDKDGNHIDETFTGVAKDVQFVICKTFTDNLESTSLGGAESEDIMSALEDCVTLGVDVINMSLGTTAGFTTTDDGDDEGEHYNRIFESIREEGISLVCAASNDYSAGFGSVYGTNLATNPDSGTVGSPSTYYAAMSVASISGQRSQYLLASDGTPIFIENAGNGSGETYDFVHDMLDGNDYIDGWDTDGDGKATLEYVVVGSGQTGNYGGQVANLISGRIALIKRGISTFQEKVELAISRGAIGIIIWNNVSGTVTMSLGDISKENLRPTVSISMDAGNKLVELAASGQGGIVGSITIDKSNEAGPFMSSFSSWGTTNDLKIKPEIAAHGGEITSTVPGGYAEQSGTSMAAPNMSGLTALVRNLVQNKPALASLVTDGSGNISRSAVTQLTNQLIMSTATTVLDQNNLLYSPRKQGAGLATLTNIMSTGAYLFTDEESDNHDGKNLYYAGKDGRPKIELGEDEEEKGEYTFSFKIKNFGGTDLTFTPKAYMMTETIDSTGVAVAEKAYMLDDIAPVFKYNGSSVSGDITVAAGATGLITVTLKMSEAEKNYIRTNFKNGMFVEGFISLESNNSAQCNLNLPFLTFFGDWEKAPMLDYTAFEIAANQQDASVLEEDKLQETIWATQPYGSYNGENYVIPLGSFLYTQEPGADEMYANEEYIAISRFNEIVSEDGRGNYTAVYNIRCLYAGLLRNAQKVQYRMYDAYTGELVYSGEHYRISKAYSNGGSAVPAYVELKLSPEELGLKSNGKYRFDFEFLFDKDDEPRKENTFSFNFYVDYEAPVLQDARLRYVNTTDENGKDAQDIYLDFDIFDNHYAQSLMLCYIDTSDGTAEMKLATSYVTPIHNANRNGTTTVSIKVTDIWEEYKDSLAVQIDDYALNHSSYVLSALGTSVEVENTVNRGLLPDTFELAEGEEYLTLNINEMHKASLVYSGDADLSNFEWTSPTHYIAVKNGEIVGLESTNGKAYPVIVNNRKGVSRTIYVTVTDTVSAVRGLSFSFGTIECADESIKKAEGTVQVYAGEDFKLDIIANPWYFNGEMSVTWDSNKPEVATVDGEGNIHTRQKGSATITATIVVNGLYYYTSVNISVLDEFTVSNMSLTRYRGEGEDWVNPNTGVVEHNVVIVPSSKAVLYIGDEAFKDNDVIKKIIIPATVMQIGKRAFQNCTALEEVYFMSDLEVEYDKTKNPDFVPDSDLTLINKNAFDGCTSLRVLDLRYTKVFTVGSEVFKDCTSLTTIVKSSAIGTASDRAFMNCSSLESIDLTGMHVAGANVFSGCTKLKDIETGKFTAIGDGMFSSLRYDYQEYSYETGTWSVNSSFIPACTALESITIKSSSVGNGAFENCENLKTVVFEGQDGGSIGARAFRNCALTSVTFSGSTIKTIGAEAFAGNASLAMTLPNGLASVGADAFSGTAFNGTNTNGAIVQNGTLLMYIGTASAITEANFTSWGVTAIAPYAFANNTNLTSVSIPASVKEIGEGAFSGCENLASVSLGSGITQIAPYLLYNTAVTSINVPSTVKEIGDYAFGLTPVSSFSYTPAQNATLGNFVFFGCAELPEINLLNLKITGMGDGVFYGCTSLTKAYLPALKELGTGTFYLTPALSYVEFNENATVTGAYTFYAASVSQRANLKTVILGAAAVVDDKGNNVKEIGEYAFYNCGFLTSVDLGGAAIVGDFAFYNCNALATVTGLENAEKIGAYAFYNNNAFTALNLTKATEIGDAAFMIAEGRAYTSINIPSAVTVGEYAFAGGNEAEVTIPASLTSIGMGAFASSSSLTKFVVAQDNEIFFTDDGVLYRNIGGSDYYGLVAYPAGKTTETYTVLDNTARIEGAAFFGLHAKVNRVVMPYSLATIGAMAFYKSGITEFEFCGVTAPALETEYSYVVNEYVDANNINYRGYYYANFEDFFIYYSEYGTGVATTPLTIYRPTNGTGYDNLVYSGYFANSNTTGIAMSVNAYSFVQLVDSFPTAAEISGWNKSNKTDEYVAAFAEDVKRAHEYYDNFSGDESQVELVGAERIAKFTEIETALRGVKPLFGITVTVARLRASGDFRTQYRVGEKFDMTGLVVILVYDDYSTAEADMSQITLVSPTDELQLLDNEVVLSGYGKRLSILISVTENGPEGSGCASGCGSISSMGGTTLITLSALGLLLVATTFVRKKSRGCK